jgi:outer membrane protein OmpA-like peptidoglycan-associated protein
MFGERHGGDDEEDQWLTVSDLMSGLMVIFLFIAISYIRPMLNEKNRIESIAVTWQAAETELAEALNAEFIKDFDRWNAELDHDALTVRFKSPDVLFDHARSDIKPQFQEILRDFFPRYLNVLARFKESIEEVRIEGHTSSGWTGIPSDAAYFKNMELSQARTRAVLEYALNLPESAEYRPWADAHLIANGLSSSRPIRNENGVEDSDRSRRVEFRVRTNAKREIVKILQGGGP